MNKTDKVAQVMMLSGEKSAELCAAYLSVAEAKIRNRVFPFGVEDSIPTPSRYDVTTIEAAVYLLGKRGAEGEVSHTENGVSVAYESADLPASMLKGVVPMCKVVL